jgi:hypothetical protein
LPFEILLSVEAQDEFGDLRSAKSKAAAFKSVTKALRVLSDNPRHPGLATQEYSSLIGPDGVKVYEAYAQNQTPGLG